jgi:hypothetical protein
MGRRQIIALAGGLAFVVLVGLAIVFAVQSGDSSMAAGEESLPLADEELTATWGTYVEGLLKTPGPSVRLDQGVDIRALAGRNLPAEATETQKNDFIAGVVSGAAEQPSLLAQLHLQTQRGGDRIEFRGVAERDGHPVARFRQILRQGGVNFYDFLVAEHPPEVTPEPGGVPARAVDFFSLTAGRWQSEVIADLFRRGVLEGPNPMQRAMGRDNPLADHGDAIGTMAELVREERYEEALDHYDSLPSSVQQLNVIFSMRVDAAASAGDSERYLRILDEYAEHFPEDPAIRVRMLDAHFEREQWDEALEDLRAIRALFDDPYWSASEAQIAMERDEPARALELAERMMAADSSLVEGPDLALTAALALGDRAKATEYAVLLRDEYRVNLTVLEGMPGYEGLRELDLPRPD